MQNGRQFSFDMFSLVLRRIYIVYTVNKMRNNVPLSMVYLTSGLDPNTHFGIKYKYNLAKSNTLLFQISVQIIFSNSNTLRFFKYFLYVNVLFKLHSLNMPITSKLCHIYFWKKTPIMLLIQQSCIASIYIFNVHILDLITFRYIL